MWKWRRKTFFSLRRFCRRERRLDLFLPALLESESATKIIPPTDALTHARTQRKRRPPRKRRAEKRGRPRASVRACSTRRSPTRPRARNKRNQRRRWATNRSLISQVASFKFKEWRTGQTPCGLPDRFYIIASFGISRSHRLEAPAPIRGGFELRARAMLAGADRCEGGKK